MRIGALNQTYRKARSFCRRNKDIIKGIIMLISILIAIIPLISAVNRNHGGFKGLYIYREQVYIELETLMKESIVKDPYIDLKKLDNSDINYTCDYDSKSNTWSLTLSKGRTVVNGEVECNENGILKVETSYDSKLEYWFWNTIIIIIIIIFTAFIIEIGIFIAIYVLISLFKLACLIENLIITKKKKRTK